MDISPKSDKNGTKGASRSTQIRQITSALEFMKQIKDHIEAASTSSRMRIKKEADA